MKFSFDYYLVVKFVSLWNKTVVKNNSGERNRRPVYLSFVQVASCSSSLPRRHHCVSYLQQYYRLLRHSTTEMMRGRYMLNDVHQLISSVSTAASYSVSLFFLFPCACCVLCWSSFILYFVMMWAIKMTYCCVFVSVCITRLISVNDANGVQTWTYCQRLTGCKRWKHWTMERNKL